MGRIVASSPYKIEIVKTDGTRQTERWDNRIMGGRPSASRLAEMSAKVPGDAGRGGLLDGEHLRRGDRHPAEAGGRRDPEVGRDPGHGVSRMRPRTWTFTFDDLTGRFPGVVSVMDMLRLARHLAAKEAGVSPDSLWALDDEKARIVRVRNLAALRAEQDRELETMA